jgi:hypothetical protein
MIFYGVWNCQFASRVYISWWTKLAAFVKGKLPVNEHSPNLWHTYFEQLLFTVARKQAKRLPENKSGHNRQRKKLWNSEFINKNCCITSQPTAKKFTEHFIAYFLSSKKTGFFSGKILFTDVVTHRLPGPANRHRTNARTLDSNNTLHWLKLRGRFASTVPLVVYENKKW